MCIQKNNKSHRFKLHASRSCRLFDVFFIYFQLLLALVTGQAHQSSAVKAVAYAKSQPAVPSPLHLHLKSHPSCTLAITHGSARVLRVRGLNLLPCQLASTALELRLSSGYQVFVDFGSISSWVQKDSQMDSSSSSIWR